MRWNERCDNERCACESMESEKRTYCLSQNPKVGNAANKINYAAC